MKDKFVPNLSEARKVDLKEYLTVQMENNFEGVNPLYVEKRVPGNGMDFLSDDGSSRRNREAPDLS